MNNYLFLILFVWACNRAPQEILVHNVGQAQGTTYSIKYLEQNETDYQWEIDSILKVIDESMSTYVSNSIISQVNNGLNVPLDEHFIKVFKTAQFWSNETKGMFDCTIFPLIEAWGFGNTLPTYLDSSDVKILLSKIGFQNITIQGDTILVNPKEMKLNFNAIAQGYTVDVIAEFLHSKNITNYLIELGGELRAKGVNSNGKAWIVGIDKPSNKIDQNDRFQVVLNLKDKSLATSGNYRKYYIQDGKVFSHTIDPISGYPAQHSLLSATVLASDCMTADAVATALMVMGIKDAQQFLENHSELDAILIFKNGDGSWEDWMTEGFEACLVN